MPYPTFIAGEQLTATDANIIASAYVQVGETILLANASSLSVSSIPTRKDLLVIVDIVGHDIAGTPRLRFNGDVGANYDYRWSANVGAYNSGTGVTFIELGQSQLNPQAFWIRIMNRLATNKRIEWTGSGAGPASFYDHYHGSARWSNVITQITSIALSSSVNNFLAGTRLTVFAPSN